ncbi:hypothetical protein E8E15_010575 [Penicillium rubens]|nr:hypothetical protein E8E15_010575 [Penicillium rubens]
MGLETTESSQNEILTMNLIQCGISPVEAHQQLAQLAATREAMGETVPILPSTACPGQTENTFRSSDVEMGISPIEGAVMEIRQQRQQLEIEIRIMGDHVQIGGRRQA